MKLLFKPKTKLEIFGNKVYNLLVENFSRTYLVGGTVRDLLLKKEISDLDIATEAKPEKVNEVLKKYFIDTNLAFVNLGVVLAVELPFTAAVATFRKEAYTSNRYPKITYTKEPKIDSQRRDFTINALYLSANSGKILDFHRGLGDLKKKKIRFIGNPSERIHEDPLRILRAIRFKVDLKFQLEMETKKALQKNFARLYEVSDNKLKQEMGKIKNISAQKKISKIIFSKKSLDKSFY